MTRTVICFRGRRTAGIVADARAAGVILDDDEIIIVCRQDDPIAEPGDITHEVVRIGIPAKQYASDHDHDIVVVCNGGTTAQLVPLLCRLAGEAAFLGGYRPGGRGTLLGGRGWRWEALEVQPDGVRHLAGDAIALERAACVPEHLL